MPHFSHNYLEMRESCFTSTKQEKEVLSSFSNLDLVRIVDADENLTWWQQLLRKDHWQYRVLAAKQLVGERHLSETDLVNYRRIVHLLDGGIIEPGHFVLVSNGRLMAYCYTEEEIHAQMEELFPDEKQRDKIYQQGLTERI